MRCQEDRPSPPNPLATYLPSTHAVQHRPFSSGHVPQRRRAIRHELVKGEKDRRGEGSGGYKPPAARHPVKAGQTPDPP